MWPFLKLKLLCYYSTVAADYSREWWVFVQLWFISVFLTWHYYFSWVEFHPFTCVGMRSVYFQHHLLFLFLYFPLILHGLRSLACQFLRLDILTAGSFPGQSCKHSIKWWVYVWGRILLVHRPHHAISLGYLFSALCTASPCIVYANYLENSNFFTAKTIEINIFLRK